MKNGGVGRDDFLRRAIREREREKAIKTTRAFIAVSALAAVVERHSAPPPKEILE